jgi:hypothetical protein
LAKLAVKLLWHKGLIGGLAILLFSGLAPVTALAKYPSPLCAVQPVPNYPRVGEPPNVKLWTKSDLDSGWALPNCTVWPRGATSIVVALAGHFKYEGGADALLARIGAVSSLVQVRYWSVTDRQWNNMFTRAVALDRLDPRTLRHDFSAAELRAGSNLYFVAADIRSGKDAVSSLHVTAADSAHFVVETENVTPLRWTFLTYANPGSLQTWYFFDRDTDSTWHFYSLTRVLYASSLFGSVIPNKSYINRGVAMYRHFLNLPTDSDPPAAP